MGLNPLNANSNPVPLEDPWDWVQVNVFILYPVTLIQATCYWCASCDLCVYKDLIKIQLVDYFLMLPRETIMLYFT